MNNKNYQALVKKLAGGNGNLTINFAWPTVAEKGQAAGPRDEGKADAANQKAEAASPKAEAANQKADAVMTKAASARQSRSGHNLNILLQQSLIL